MLLLAHSALHFHGMAHKYNELKMAPHARPCHPDVERDQHRDRIAEASDGACVIRVFRAGAEYHRVCLVQLACQEQLVATQTTLL